MSPWSPNCHSKGERHCPTHLAVAIKPLPKLVDDNMHIDDIVNKNIAAGGASASAETEAMPVGYGARDGWYMTTDTAVVQYLLNGFLAPVTPFELTSMSTLVLPLAYTSLALTDCILS